MSYIDENGINDSESMICFMKVLLISSVFPNSVEPVRGIFSFQIVRELQKLCNITVISPLPWIPPFLARWLKGEKYVYAQVPKIENLTRVSDLSEGETNSIG